MTWHTTHSTSLQGQEEAFSLTSYLDTIRLERARLNPTRETSCLPDSETESCPTSLYGMMWLHSTEIHGADQLTSSAEDSPAKTLVRQVKERELPESVQAYGKNMRDSLERCDLVLSSPKTPHYCGRADSALSSETLPRWGMMLDGECWELGQSVRRTSETGCGYLPTPLCKDTAGDCPSERRRNSPHMESAIKIELGIPVEKKCWLNPCFSEKLMGWIKGWTDLKPLGMDRFLKWRQQHLTFCQKD